MPKKRRPRTQALSPQEAYDLDVEIGFLEGLVRRDPRYLDALLILADNYTRRGRYAEGLGIDQQLCRQRPRDPVAHYNLACSFALTAQPEAAAEALHQALDLGYRDFGWLRRDPDLKGLRQHPDYRRIRARIRALEIGAH